MKPFKPNMLRVSVLVALLLFYSAIATIAPLEAVARSVPDPSSLLLDGEATTRSEGENMSTISAIWQAGWRIGAFVTLWAGLYAPFILAGSSYFEEPGAGSPWFRLYVEGAGAGTILLASWVMLHFIDQRPLVSLGFSSDALGQDVTLGTALGAGTLALTLAILWSGGWLHPATDAGEPAWSVLPLAALTVLLNVITQELLVRGYPWQALQTHLGPTAAWIGSSALFAAAHYGAARGAPLPLFNAFLSGLLYGYAYLATGNLWTAVALHWAWNFVSGPLLGMNVSGLGRVGSPLYYEWSLVRIEGPELVTGGSFGFEGGLAGTLATAIGLLALYLAYPQALR